MGCTQSGTKESVASPSGQEPIDLVITDPGADATPFVQRYFLKSDVLGKGNYSVVKEGVDRATSSQVAVKCITKASLTKEDTAA